MFIHRIRLKNLLSFGPKGLDLELKPLNVLIGPNGSGKSNFIEAVGLLKAAPRDFREPILEGGGVGDWIWRGAPGAMSASVEVVVDNPQGRQPLRYGFEFAQRNQHFWMVSERLEEEGPCPDKEDPRVCFEADEVMATINYLDPANGNVKQSKMGHDGRSVLSKLKDPNNYPEITFVGNEFDRIHLYRQWSFGRNTPVRLPQKPDLPNNHLIEDLQNLGLVLNRLMRDYDVRQRLLKALGDLYEGVSDFHVNIEYGTVQVFLQEGKVAVPATRLSDGTLRYLCLLVILCHPDPPPLVCIEEPELGLHPDILPGLADLLRDASERCQLIVTTHSDVLVDALSDTPESIVVCEKHEGQTTLRRLDKEKLACWLERYSLGELWMRGGLEGTRW